MYRKLYFTKTADDNRHEPVFSPDYLPTEWSLSLKWNIERLFQIFYFLPKYNSVQARCPKPSVINLWPPRCTRNQWCWIEEADLDWIYLQCKGITARSRKVFIICSVSKSHCVGVGVPFHYQRNDSSITCPWWKLCTNDNESLSLKAALHGTRTRFEWIETMILDITRSTCSSFNFILLQILSPEKRITPTTSNGRITESSAGISATALNKHWYWQFWAPVCQMQAVNCKALWSIVHLPYCTCGPHQDHSLPWSWCSCHCPSTHDGKMRKASLQLVWIWYQLCQSWARATRCNRGVGSKPYWEQIVSRQSAVPLQPTSFPHFGGAWERLMRPTKKALKAIAREQWWNTVNLHGRSWGHLEQQATKPVSSDCRDDEHQSPNLFILGHASVSIPRCVTTNNVTSYSHKHWKHTQLMTDHFSRHWLHEHVPTLSRRSKWSNSTRNMAEGELVLINESNVPRDHWPLGSIERCSWRWWHTAQGRPRVVPKQDPSSSCAA